MTKGIAKKWLPVVRNLKRYYEGKNEDYLHSCPLCIFVDKNRLKSCNGCLWRLFEGTDCPTFQAVVGRQSRSRAWVEEAILRIKRWEKELKKIINKRRIVK